MGPCPDQGESGKGSSLLADDNVGQQALWGIMENVFSKFVEILEDRLVND